MSSVSSSSPPPTSEHGYYQAPPTNDGQIEVIDLADSDAEADPAPVAIRGTLDITQIRRQPVRLSSSPEVEFVGENIRHPEVHVPRPIIEPGNATEVPVQLPGFFHTIRNATTHVFGHLINPQQNRAPAPIPRPIDPLVVEGDDFAGLQFDYQQQGFAMQTRDSEAPAIVGDDYKAPPAPKDGFTRNLEEEEILICPFCKEELAAGDGEVKQQIWIVKQCGHVSFANLRLEQKLTYPRCIVVLARPAEH